MDIHTPPGHCHEGTWNLGTVECTCVHIWSNRGSRQGVNTFKSSMSKEWWLGRAARSPGYHHRVTRNSGKK